MAAFRTYSTAIALMITLASASAAIASSGGSKPASDPTFVAMPELVLPIVDGDRADGRLKIKIVLRATDVEGAARLRIAIPALRENALASASEFARLRASPYKPVDVGRLSHDITVLLRGSNADVAAVLLIEVSARPV